MGPVTTCNSFFPFSVFLFCISYCSAFPSLPAHVVLTTVTVIEKPTCFVLPSSLTLPPCDLRKKRQAQLEQSFSNLGAYKQLPVDAGNFPSDVETFLESSISPQSRHKRQHSDLTVWSTVLITKTASKTQRFVPGCMDPEETYEPLCPPKPVKKDWGYHGLHTPDKWSEVDITCASGEEESPIEILTNETIYASFQNLELDGYHSKPKQFVVANNGHTLVVSLRDSPNPIAKNGGLSSEYEFSQMHFHWGETSNDGSEHVIDGKRYPMEIHMVHYNKKYGSLTQAVAHHDGLEVLSILVEISTTANHAFGPLIAVTDELVQPDSSVVLPGKYFALGDFLPNTEDFYRYHGSLTTPSCNQAVSWTVFADTLKISEDQIKNFRKLLDHEKEPISGNYRPLQKLFGRDVFKSF